MRRIRGITGYLNADFIIEEFLLGLVSRFFRPLNVVTITRNMRVVASITKFASFIYPDPAYFEKHGKLKESNSETWKIINDVVSKSWNPNRKIERVGSVLVGSYADSPWLILPKSPRHYLRSVYEMT